MPNDKEDKDISEQLTESRIHELINAALLGNSKRSEKRFAEMLEQSLTQFRDKLTEPKAEVAQAIDKPSAASPEVAALQKQLEAMQKQIKEKDLAVAAQSKSMREKEAYGQLKSMLSGKVKPEAIEHVAKLIFHADKKVVVGEDGQMTFRSDDDSEIDINEGVKQYLKSKDASIFLPAPVSKSTPAKTSFGNIQMPSSHSGEEVKPNAAQAAALLQKLGLSIKS
jgi:hypothetical protein